MPEPKRSFDVVIAGAGPAGSALAQRLASAGLCVALVERSGFDVARIGESLAPAIEPLLRELGVWDRFLGLGALPSWGTLSVWGSESPNAHSHLQSPFGRGFHVDRRAFDRMLARAAVDAGAVLLDHTSVTRCRWRDGSFRIDLSDMSAESRSDERRRLLPAPLSARVVVDATGRTAHVARQLGARPLAFDRLVGVAARWDGIVESQLGHLVVETGPAGWWYSAPLPHAEPARDPSMMTMLMTDADLCASHRFTEGTRFLDELESARATRDRVRAASLQDGPRVHCAGSQRVRNLHVRTSVPWLTVGDAGLAVDPVSGSGVLRALRAAAAAADVVCSMLSHTEDWRAALHDYESARDVECNTYLHERAHYYAAESRFHTPFWARRARLGRAA